MQRRAIHTRLAVAGSTAVLACALGAAVPALVSASGGGSTVCNAVGAPSTTQTVGVQAVFHVTVFACGNAQATGFQQCANQTVAVPNVTHATVYGLNLTGGICVLGLSQCGAPATVGLPSRA